MVKLNTVGAVVGAALVLGLLALGTDGFSQGTPPGPGPGPGPGRVPTLSVVQIQAGLNGLLGSDPIGGLPGPLFGANYNSSKSNTYRAAGGSANDRNVLNVTGNPWAILGWNPDPLLGPNYNSSKSNIKRVAQGQGDGPVLVGKVKNGNGLDVKDTMRTRPKGNIQGQPLPGAVLEPGGSYAIVAESFTLQGEQFVALTVSERLKEGAQEINDMFVVLVKAEAVVRVLSDDYLTSLRIDPSLWDEYASAVLLNLVACFLEGSNAKACGG